MEARHAQVPVQPQGARDHDAHRGSDRAGPLPLVTPPVSEPAEDSRRGQVRPPADEVFAGDGLHAPWDYADSGRPLRVKRDSGTDYERWKADQVPHIRSLPTG